MDGREDVAVCEFINLRIDFTDERVGKNGMRN